MAPSESNPKAVSGSLGPLAAHNLQDAALAATSDGIAITNRDGSVAWVNPAFSTLTGYTFDEALGKGLHNLVKSDQQDPAVYQRLWEKTQSGHTWRGELVNRRKDGTHYHEAQTITPVCNEFGAITHFITIKQDLTERRNAEFRLVSSERRYRRLFESAKDGILILDAETGTVVDVNPFLATLLGFPLGEILGKQVWDLGFLKDIVANKASFDELQRNDYIRYDDKPLETSEGRKIDVEFISNIYLVDGIRVIQCNIRDITARKAADRQISDQNDILANSHEGVMIVSPANQITLWNRGAAEILGWTSADAVGHPPDQLLGIEDSALAAAWHAAVAQAGFWNGEMRLRTRSKQHIVAEVRTTRILNRAGKTRASLSFLTDITEKKLLAEKFLHTQRLESIGMLAAGIAHDLNNVLAPITFAAPLLRKNLSFPADLRVLSILEQSAARGASLVKQILGFARNASAEFSPTQVRHLLRDVASVIEETFPKSIRLETHIPSELWPVLGNATQIHQILMNLCINARDAMLKGGTLTLTAANRTLRRDEIKAHIGAEPGAWLMLEVADTGVGMSPEILSHIWEPFYTTKIEGKGTGLGLSTVQSIVQQHRGFVEVLQSGAGGATFRVLLPAWEDLPVSNQAAADAISPTGHGELVLVVDDDPLIRELVSEILVHHGYRAEVCANGIEAMACFGSHPNEISLVITDVDMPLLGGLELARSLLRVRSDIRVLVISGLAHGKELNSPTEGLMNLTSAFLLKPFTPPELLVAVNNLYHPVDRVKT